MRNAVHIPDIPYLEIAKGRVPGHSIIHKFGAGNITTTLKPITQDLTYPTPTTAIALEFVSDSVDDTALGSGAREVTVTGLDANWLEVTQTVITNGLTPVQLSTNLTRLYRWYVSASGTYASETAGSHVGNLKIRVSGVGATWSTLTTTPFAVGQSQIGIYSIADGKTGYLISKNMFADTSKTADVYFFYRPGINIVAAPFSTMRLFEREVGVSGGYALKTEMPKGPLVGPCDIGFMGKVTTTAAQCSVEFELLIIENKYVNP